ncbi:MAG: hypothetical protein QOE96_866 [Blastocatellia bacterium]|nr:hypothetical protein [Blastocatellia bacterium]
MKTPVAFIIFNRPDRTARVFAEIAKARPAKLLVVADGPRPDHPGERELCLATRSVLAKVDWPCEVLTNFSDTNLGCRRRVATGLDWVFEQVEEAIILEDDCLPDESFFPFCIELLERYRDDPRVGMICGSNFQGGKRRSPESYFFGLHVTVWGWASWRRAWRNYDVEMRCWPELRDTSWLADLLANPVAAKYWRDVFEDTFNGEFDTWDYQFFFSWWRQNSLALIPDRNLVTNIGFGSAATRTREALPSMANLPVKPIAFPLAHPADVELNREADNFSFKQICPWIVENQNYYWQLRHKFTAALPDPVREKVRQLRTRLRG